MLKISMDGFNFNTRFIDLFSFFLVFFFFDFPIVKRIVVN